MRVRVCMCVTFKKLTATMTPTLRALFTVIQIPLQQVVVVVVALPPCSFAVVFVYASLIFNTLYTLHFLVVFFLDFFLAAAFHNFYCTFFSAYTHTHTSKVCMSVCVYVFVLYLRFFFSLT